MDPSAGREARESLDRERMQVVDDAIPGWMAPAMAVAFAGYFAVQDLAGPAIRHVMVFVFALGYLGFTIGPLIRRRPATQSRLRADLLSPRHHRRAQVAATVLLVLLLGGTLVVDRLGWPHGSLVYGVVLGLAVIGGGWWLRRSLACELRTVT